MAKPMLRQIRRVASSALIATTALLVCAWPTPTHADDVESALAKQQEIPTEATQIGSLVAWTRVVPDQEIKSWYYLELVVVSTTHEGAENAKIETCIERTTYGAGARGAPPPQVVWKTLHDVRVAPGETVVKRVRIPSQHSWRIYQSHQPPKLDPHGFPSGPQVDYSSRVLLDA